MESCSAIAGEEFRVLHGTTSIGPVILALVDVNGENIPGLKPKPLPDYIYFAVRDVEKVYERARELQCLSTEDVHGESAGDLVRRPWGERSFYAHDP